MKQQKNYEKMVSALLYLVTTGTIVVFLWQAVELL